MTKLVLKQIYLLARRAIMLLALLLKLGKYPANDNGHQSHLHLVIRQVRIPKMAILLMEYMLEPVATSLFRSDTGKALRA